jgi:hypothetical protein
MIAANDSYELLGVLWNLLKSHFKNNACGKMTPPDVLGNVALSWIGGDSFEAIHQEVTRLGGRMRWGEKFRDFKIEHIVEICENGLAFDGGLIVGAVVEAIQLGGLDSGGDLLPRLLILQKSLKYGIVGKAAISLYELGFADRVVIKHILEHFGFEDEGRSRVMEVLSSQSESATGVVAEFPRYFRNVMAEILD